MTASDSKLAFYKTLRLLMAQIVRRASVVELPVLLPSLLQVCEAFSFSVKSAKNAFALGLRVYDLASYLQRAEPAAEPLKRLKLDCLRSMVKLYLRWYKYVDAASLCKKLHGEASAMFGRDAAETHVALTQYAYCLLRSGSGSLKNAKAMLRQVLDYTSPLSSTSDFMRDLHIAAASNYALVLACASSPDAAVKIFTSLGAKVGPRAGLMVALNHAALNCSTGDFVNGVQILDGWLRAAPAGESVEAVAVLTQLLRCSLECGKAVEAIRFGDQLLQRCKRLSIPSDAMARILVLIGEAHALTLSPKAVTPFAQAVAQLESKFGGSHPVTLESKCRFIEVSHMVGSIDSTEAVERLVDCSTAAKSTLGEQHPTFGRVLACLARVQACVDYEVASETITEAIGSLARLGPSHTEHLNALSSAALWAASIGNVDAGLTLAKSASTAAECFAAGACTRVRANFVNAVLLKDTGDLFEAITLLEEECAPFASSVPAPLGDDILELRAELTVLSFEEDYQNMFSEDFGGDDAEAEQGLHAYDDAGGMDAASEWTSEQWAELANMSEADIGNIANGTYCDVPDEPEAGSESEPKEDNADSGVIGGADTDADATTVTTQAEGELDNASTASTLPLHGDEAGVSRSDSSSGSSSSASDTASTSSGDTADTVPMPPADDDNEQ